MESTYLSGLFVPRVCGSHPSLQLPQGFSIAKTVITAEFGHIHVIRTDADGFVAIHCGRQGGYDLKSSISSQKSKRSGYRELTHRAQDSYGQLLVETGDVDRAPFLLAVGQESVEALLELGEMGGLLFETLHDADVVLLYKAQY